MLPYVLADNVAVVIGVAVTCCNSASELNVPLNSAVAGLDRTIDEVLVGE